ncbi:hypothetical protein [Actinoplanes derwentensis]|uniref:Uncharacterized protein n=1 Tax=Actinoplanes derwentensis TaxID=113562 RepID=A0A1H1RHD9_9ACTN|nr:hypothetical protein [Actinoplanes derwentensis]GID89405.1 hypothetical protein Ade03nite_83290 [Actinoplanes derwentensis]SDS34966.1 hypothetical protein SAMN04489716_0587 [Actinoplanes derwentensis]
MGRKHELTIRVPEAGTVAGAVAQIREEQELEYHSVTVDIGDDGRFTARAVYPSSKARVDGQVTDDGSGPVLTAVIHKPRPEILWPFLMGFPAVFLPLCTFAQFLFEGIWQPLVFIGIPGGAALGYLYWKIVRQQKENFRTDVATFGQELRVIVGHPANDAD